MCDIVKLDKYQTCRRKIGFFDLLHYARIDDEKIREKNEEKENEEIGVHHIIIIIIIIIAIFFSSYRESQYHFNKQTNTRIHLFYTILLPRYNLVI